MQSTGAQLNSAPGLFHFPFYSPTSTQTSFNEISTPTFTLRYTVRHTSLLCRVHARHTSTPEKHIPTARAARRRGQRDRRLGGTDILE